MPSTPELVSIDSVGPNAPASNPPVPFEPTDPRLLNRAAAIARAAGARIMPISGRGTTVRTKVESSPVAAADETADALTTHALREPTPATPVVCEESAGQFDGKAFAGMFWLVDPWMARERSSPGATSSRWASSWSTMEHRCSAWYL